MENHHLNIIVVLWNLEIKKKKKTVILICVRDDMEFKSQRLPVSDIDKGQIIDFSFFFCFVAVK